MDLLIRRALELMGYGKVNVFILSVQFLHEVRSQRAQVAHDAPHKLLGRRCAGRYADDFHAIEPFRIDLGFIIDQVSRHAQRRRNFAQAL